jgi:hypothetical protein
MKWFALAVLAAFAWWELRPEPESTVAVPQNPLGIPTAPPAPSVGANSSVLSPSQTGSGLFGNPTGLGNNPVPMPTHELTPQPLLRALGSCNKYSDPSMPGGFGEVCYN